ncbi:MAG: DUF6184 family natural product biosynthesis lipoprotein [Polyangiaceae bacterium]
MKFGSRHAFALSLGCAAVIAACSNSKPSTTTTTAAPGATRFDSVADKLATARCNHEVTCNDIGADKKYATREACLADSKATGVHDLNAQCPGTVDQRQVDKCVAEFKSEGCGNVIDTAKRVNDCSIGQLCPHSSVNSP